MKKLAGFLLSFSFLSHGIAKTTADPSDVQIRHVRGVPVISSPYFGERSKLEAFDLFVNIPDILQSVRLLEQVQMAEDRLAARGMSFPDEPTVDLSGRVEVYGGGTRNRGGSLDRSFKLGNAELDIFARVSKFANAFFNLKYDNSNMKDGIPGQDSRFNLDQGFLTFGNLNI